MKKQLILLLALMVLVGTAVPSSADNFPLVPNTWVVLQEFNGATPWFFTGGGAGTGYWTYNGPGTLKVTDLFVATDRFNVYDNNVLVATFAGGTDWDAAGYADAFTSPPYTTDPDIAWGTAEFAKGTHNFGVGSHAFSFEDIHIPPVTAGGSPFNDGTIAFQVVPLPSALVLFGPGLLGLFGWRRFRKA
jgi:hypothetical protein